MAIIFKYHVVRHRVAIRSPLTFYVCHVLCIRLRAQSRFPDKVIIYFCICFGSMSEKGEGRERESESRYPCVPIFNQFLAPITLSVDKARDLDICSHDSPSSSFAWNLPSSYRETNWEEPPNTIGTQRDQKIRGKSTTDNFVYQRRYKDVKKPLICPFGSMEQTPSGVGKMMTPEALSRLHWTVDWKRDVSVSGGGWFVMTLIVVWLLLGEPLLGRAAYGQFLKAVSAGDS